MTGTGLLLASVYLACLVEGVEALTIVLAAGTARDWRSALTGTGAAVLVLGVVAGAAGPAVAALPLSPLRLVIGGLLLIFGLQWLRKAILRSAGIKALHDEDEAYAQELAAARAAGRGGRFSVPDWYAFTLAFKGTLLEGLEVVFIVVTVGANENALGPAALAAVAAVLTVVLTGLAVRRPLARLPENVVKFAVGIMLTSLGMFWGAEGAGAHWPGSDAAIPVLVVATALASVGAAALLRRRSLVVAR
jgi:uncharacterized membrane protein